MSREEGPSEGVSTPFSTVSPVDGEPLDRVTATEPDEIGERVSAAAKTQVAWAHEPVYDRVEVVAGVKKRLLERAEEIAHLLHRETGKPVEEAALAEVLPNADLVTYWCEHVEELLESEPVDLDPMSYPRKRGRIVHAPLGVVALITPWNYPVAIPLRTIVPALLAGNAVVFKPSEVTPRSGALVASLFEGLLPDGLLTVVQGGAEQGRALVEADVDTVVFTGSVPTGKAIARACAERLVPCSLELGGKDAAIVLDDCDVTRTANGIAWGAFTNAGQNCAAIERVYVHRPVAERFVKALVEATQALDPERDLAKITTKEQHATVCSHLEDARAAGAKVLVGGDPERDGHDFPPTILQIEPEAASARFMRDETFGPLLPVMIVEDEDEAVELVNASRYALTTSVWTRRMRRGRELAERLGSGVVTVNNHGFTAALAAAPWTGRGDTGYGVTGSRHALHALTRVRFVLEDRNRAKRELWWYPYTPALRRVAFAMAKLRGGGGLWTRVVGLFQLLAALPKRLVGG